MCVHMCRYVSLPVHTQTYTHTQPFYVSLDFVLDNPREPVPEETFTDSHLLWTSVMPYLLPHLLRFMASSLFNFHAHTIATCFALVPRLCDLISISLSLNPLLGTLSCSFMPHIHLTILISAHWSAISFSFLMGQVSLPCNILVLYNLPLTIGDIW